MRLHELKEGKVYIGEDGREYKILCNGLWHLCNNERHVVTRLSTLTQNFSPKKVKRTVEERCWLNIYPRGRSDCLHPTEESAGRNATSGRIACVELRGTYEIEVEE